MKYTLLDLTQNILSSLNADEVNSITDTTESRQISEIIRTTYFNIISRANLPEHKQIISLTASGDTGLPTVMYRPDNVIRINWIKYDKSPLGLNDSPDYQYVTILPIQQFLDMVHSFNPEETDIDVLEINGFRFFYRNDKHPDYCTFLEDSTIVFDSFLSTIENTLQQTKTLCFGQITEDFTMSDTFIPVLDDIQFPLLLNEAKSTAFIELKQVPNEVATRDSRRQWVTLQRTKSINSVPNSFDSLPNFGRIQGGTVRTRL